MFPLPIKIQPRHVLPRRREMGTVIDSYLPLLTAMRNVIVNEGIGHLRHGEMKRSRISNLAKHEQLRVYLLQFLRELEESYDHDLWFATIDLTPEETKRPSEVVNSLFKRMNTSPSWVGVNVPLDGNPHVHFMCAVPMTAHGINHLVSFERRRNCIKAASVPKSVYIRDVYYVQGLYNYFCKADNLGLDGAKVMACRSIKSQCRLFAQRSRSPHSPDW